MRRHHSHFQHEHGFGTLPGFPHHTPPQRPEPPMGPMPFAAGGPWPGALGAMAGFRGGRRGGRRQRRGNVRAAVLALLAERPMHGYEMIQELGERTNGVWRPSPGSVYPTLQMLDDEGLIIADAASGKKLFTLTESGRAEAAKLGEAKPWADAVGEADEVRELHTALRQLFMAVEQITQAGTEDQKSRAVDAINEAKRRVYGLLAEDVDDDDTESI
ncbi:PadR family transcriptional regulator [Kutzneria sp. CA-103260]|uniref:PadR family transcriptional regulator n=1 Tax=Kutzneria sp. CA-103260 TaxID=2802641 RepID=UPI001BEEAE49|nr:PadR family transcriptional regulator [Kutzneria sp. CA-103260]QUQ71526.1 Transcriptional regulator PadR-like family protein [Kutzneria sp. CA-103260]